MMINLDQERQWCLSLSFFVFFVWVVKSVVTSKGGTPPLPLLSSQNLFSSPLSQHRCSLQRSTSQCLREVQRKGRQPLQIVRRKQRRKHLLNETKTKLINMSTLELSKHKLSKLAWLSLCISLLIGLSHVRSFPSYNIAISLIALHSGAQEEIALVLKSSSICVIIGISSILADVAFCFLWTKEVRHNTNS